MIRQIQQDDLERLMNWLVDQPWPFPIVDNCMSKFGFVVSDEDGDVVFGYVYLTETGLAFLDWLGLNPDRDFNAHKVAALELCDKLEGMLSAFNAEPKVGCLVLHTRIQWLAEALKEKGYRSQRQYIRCTKLLK